jgi:hypothetical protein
VINLKELEAALKDYPEYFGNGGKAMLILTQELSRCAKALAKISQINNVPIPSKGTKSVPIKESK